jgi:hypothetical protein
MFASFALNGAISSGFDRAAMSFCDLPLLASASLAVSSS